MNKKTPNKSQSKTRSTKQREINPPLLQQFGPNTPQDPKKWFDEAQSRPGEMLENVMKTLAKDGPNPEAEIREEDSGFLNPNIPTGIIDDPIECMAVGAAALHLSEFPTTSKRGREVNTYKTAETHQYVTADLIENKFQNGQSYDSDNFLMIFKKLKTNMGDTADKYFKLTEGEGEWLITLKNPYPSPELKRQRQTECIPTSSKQTKVIFPDENTNQGASETEIVNPLLESYLKFLTPGLTLKSREYGLGSLKISLGSFSMREEDVRAYFVGKEIPTTFRAFVYTLAKCQPKIIRVLNKYIVPLNVKSTD